MEISDIMRKPAVTVGTETTMLEVARLMVDTGAGCIVVTNAGGRAQGVVTVRDFVPRGAGSTSTWSARRSG